MSEAVLETLRRLPKTDLHCHLDGSLRPLTVLELGRRYKVKLPAGTLEGLLPHVQVSPSCRSLKEFLDVFDVLYPLLRRADAVERIAYELIEDCARENIRHVEVRFAPELQRASRFSNEQVVEAAIKGLRRGLKDFGTTSSVIICLLRSHGPKANRRAFETLKRLFNKDASLDAPAVVGLDIAGDEARYPTSLYSDYYEEARSLGMWTTCHSGETEGTENLKAALDLRVGRIGHGTHLLEDPRLTAEVARRGVPLEIGLTSNVRTRSVASLESHPARRMHESGVPITLNTDDRGILGIDLTHEYGQAMRLGFTLEELARLTLRSIDFVFLPAPQRQRLRRRFERELAQIIGPEAVKA